MPSRRSPEEIDKDNQEVTETSLGMMEELLIIGKQNLDAMQECLAVEHDQLDKLGDIHDVLVDCAGILEEILEAAKGDPEDEEEED